MDNVDDIFVPKRHVEENFEVTEDYPGLIVHEGRVSGAITPGPSRLAFYALIPTLVPAGYAGAENSYPDLPERISENDLTRFLSDLFEQRRSFARLLCVLADVERWERSARRRVIKRKGEIVSLPRWHYEAGQVRRLREALSACLRELDVLKKEDRGNDKYTVDQVSENGSAILSLVQDCDSKAI